MHVLGVEAEEHFETIFRQVYAELMRFAVRRVGSSQAADLVSETFLVAWRRLDDLPGTTGEARAWLFGIARRIALATYRSEVRAQALAVRLAQPGRESTASSHEDGVVAAVDLSRAWNRLSAAQQEVLALTALEGLNATEAGAVLSISATAFRLRLMRARRALAAQLHLTQVHALPVTTRLSFGEAD